MTKSFSSDFAGARPDEGSIEGDRLRNRLRANLLGDVDAVTRVGRYTLGRELGRGAMGVVYEATDTVLGRTVALKLLERGSGSDAGSIREAQALAALTHPNVVHVFDVGVHRGRAWLAMEQIDGTDLGTWAAQEPGFQARVEAVLALARGLTAVHQVGLLHRDVKPANVMVDRDARVVLMDFGLARAVPSTSSSAPTGPQHGAAAVTGVAGTPGFMAPELLLGGAATERADQFSLGIAALSILPDAPPAVRAVLERAAAPEPKDRWSRLTAFTDALSRAASLRKWPLRLIGIVGVGVAVVGLGAVAASFEPRAQPCARALGLQDAWAPSVPRLVTGELEGEPGERAGQRFATRVASLATAAEGICAAVEEGRWSPKRVSWADHCLAEADGSLRAVTEGLQSQDAALREVSFATLLGRDELATCIEENGGGPLGDGGTRSAKEFQSIQHELLGLERALLVEDSGDAEARMAVIWAAAVELGWPPGLRTARLRRARVRYERRSVEAALGDAQAVYYEAVAVNDWGRAADAAASMSLFLGDLRQDRTHAATWSEHAAAAERRSNTPSPLAEAAAFRRMARALHADADAGSIAQQEQGLATVEAALGASSIRASLHRVELARRLTDDDQYERAVVEATRALEDLSARLGPEHRVLEGPLAALAAVHARRGNIERARGLMRRAADIYTASSTDKLPVILMNLGMLEAQLGNFASAEDALLEGIANFKRIRGPNCPPAATGLLNLGVMYTAASRPDDAATVLHEALRIREEVFPPDHPQTAWVLVALVNLATASGELEGSDAMAARAVASFERAYGTEHSAVGEALVTWGTNRLQAGEYEPAIERFQRARRILSAAMGPDAPPTTMIDGLLSEARTLAASG